MHILGPAHLHGAHGINSPHAQRSTAQHPQHVTQTAGDKLELSDAGQIAARLAEVPDIRHQRVAELRQAIAAGTYETEEKLAIALDRLVDEIA
jgi:flagellar biosynthesis anti-sigma factor FlgM